MKTSYILFLSLVVAVVIMSALLNQPEPYVVEAIGDSATVSQ